MTTDVVTAKSVVVPLPERLRFLRTSAGLTFSSLDNLAGLRRGHSRVIEGGHRLRIEAQTVANLAEVFGVTMDWLYLGVGEDPTESEVRRAVERATARGPKPKRASAATRRIKQRRRPAKSPPAKRRALPQAEAR